MLYNKSQFKDANDKKILHKVKKQWITVSLTLLMAIGGGTVVAQTNAFANNQNDRTNYAQQNISLNNQSGSNNASLSNNNKASGSKSSISATNSHPLNVKSNAVSKSSNRSSPNKSLMFQPADKLQLGKDNPNESSTTENFNSIIKFRDNQGIYDYVVKGKKNKPIHVNGRIVAMINDQLMYYNTKYQKYEPYRNDSFTKKTIPRQYIQSCTITPRLEFLYDNGNGTYTKFNEIDNLGLNINKNNINPDGTLNYSLNVSGYKGEPYTIPINDLYDPSLYPNFTPMSNNPTLTVVLGEGYRNSQHGFNTGTNDNGNYWFNSDIDDSSNRVLKLVAKRHFTHVYFRYKNYKYDGGITNGFNGNSVDVNSLYNNLNQNLRNYLEIEGNPNYVFNDNDPQTGGSKSSPSELDINLQSKNNLSENLPIYIEKCGNGIEGNLNQPESDTKHLIHVNINNMQLGQPFNFTISRNSLEKNNSDVANDLNGNYLISEGSIYNTADLNNDGQLVNNWSLPTTNSAPFIDGKTFIKIGVDQNNNQVTPIIYYETPKPNGINNLLTIPNLNYTYRYWKPYKRDQTNLNQYNHEFVNSDYTNNTHYDPNANNYTNASDFNDSVQDTTWNINGNYMPTGSIIQQNPWSFVDHFRGENPNNPNNDWYVQLTKDNDNQVQAHFIQAAGNGYLATAKPDNILYLGLADGQNDYGTHQQVSTHVGNKSNQSGFIVSYGNKRQWYPRNATILWDPKNNGFCKYHYNKNINLGYYTYANSKTPINFVIGKSLTKTDSGTNGIASFNMGYMNTYSQPMNYKVTFMNSGNFTSTDGNILDQNRYPKNNDEGYNDYSQNVSNQIAYSGDTIYYNKSDNSFYLKNGNPNDPTKDQKLFSMPKYISSDQTQQKDHELTYDSEYEQNYLTDLNKTESNEGHYIPHTPNANNPSWTLGIGNVPLNIWPDGINLSDNDDTAVIYTASTQIKALNKISFVDLDTGQQFNNSYDNHGQNMDTLFNNEKITNNGSTFNVGDFLKQITAEKPSILTEDGSWKLHTPLLTKNGIKDLYIVRTDSPNVIEPINDTFIYVCTIDINNPKYNGKIFPLKVQYVDADNPNNPAVTSHDFTLQGGLRTDTINDVLHKNKLWNYNNDGYNEVGITTGVYHQGSTLDTSTRNNDLNNKIFNSKNIFGQVPYITIVVQKPVPQGQHRFSLNFIDEDNSNNSTLNGLDQYGTGYQGSSVTQVSNSYIANTLNSLHNNDHYAVDFYTSNYSNPEYNINNLESSNCSYTNSDQDVTVYLKETSGVTSSATSSINEHINYNKLSNGSFSMFSNYSNSAQFTHSMSENYTTGSSYLSPNTNWNPTDHRFSNVSSPSESGYTPDYSMVSAPSVSTSGDSLSVNPSNAKVSKMNDVSTYTYNVNYYPNKETQTINETIHYVVKGNNKLDPTTYTNKNVEVERDLQTLNGGKSTNGSYGVWHVIKGNLTNVNSPEVKGYDPDLEIVDAPNLNVPTLKTNYDTTVYYDKTSSSTPLAPQPFITKNTPRHKTPQNISNGGGSPVNPVSPIKNEMPNNLPKKQNRIKHKKNKQIIKKKVTSKIHKHKRHHSKRRHNRVPKFHHYKNYNLIKSHKAPFAFSSRKSNNVRNIRHLTRAKHNYSNHSRLPQTSETKNYDSLLAIIMTSLSAVLSKLLPINKHHK